MMERGSGSVRKKGRDSKLVAPLSREEIRNLSSQTKEDFGFLRVKRGQVRYFISGAGFAYSSICGSIFFLSPVITSVMLSSRMYFLVISDTFCGVTA